MVYCGVSMKRTWVILVAAMAAFLAGASGPAELVPLIEMRAVPLTDAIRQVARTARMNVILDPRLSQAPYTSMTVSVRWENVTAREALIALLDNYGLTLVETARSLPERH